MATTVWAFATGAAAGSLFKAVAAEVPRRIGEFNAHEMATTVRAFATGAAADSLFKAAAAEVPRRIGEFQAHELATTVWAFAMRRCRLALQGGRC